MLAENCALNVCCIHDRQNCESNRIEFRLHAWDITLERETGKGGGLGENRGARDSREEMGQRKIGPKERRQRTMSRARSNQKEKRIDNEHEKS